MSSSEPEQLRKIFVGGLNRRTTEETLKEYFSSWGNIVDCVIMREGKNGPSRGFGFVTFDNAKAVDDCLKVKRHEIDNWEIEPKRSVPKGEAQSRTRKIFVGGLASTATEEDVEEYFTGLCTKFGQGKVLDVDLKRDKENPNRLRGFAFVTFDSEEVVDSVCSISFHQIKLKQCEVKKAESQATMRKKEEQEMIASGGSRRSQTSEENTPNFGGFPGWGPSVSGFGGMNVGFGGSGGRGSFGSASGSGSGFGGGMAGAASMGGFGGGNFSNPAAAAALMAGGFNPAAFAGFGPGAMGSFSPGFGFNGMGFGGFGPGFFGFGGFGPGGFGAGGGGGSGSSAGANGHGAGGGSGYGRGPPSGRGLAHNSSSGYDKDSYSELAAYGMGDIKGAPAVERNPPAVLTGASSAGSSGSAYEGLNNPMAAAYGGYPGFPAGFGGFPAMGDWSQFAAAAGGASGGEGAGDYQIGNYSQMSSNYGPASRLNSRNITGGDKSNRGYRPY